MDQSKFALLCFSLDQLVLTVGRYNHKVCNI